MKTSSGLTFQPQHSLEEVARLASLDCLVLPGGQGTTAVCRCRILTALVSTDLFKPYPYVAGVLGLYP